jgi:molecular chaperone DnaK
MAADNMSLGNFRLDGIPPAPRGVPQVEVTFDIDANGILHVTARDKATGKEQKVTITASTNLSESDVDRMVQDAKSHESEDRARRELIAARNHGDSLAYQTEKTLNELGDKVPAGERETIETRVQELREALQTDDAGRIKSASEAVEHAFHALSQQLYQQEAGPAAGQPGTNPFADGFPKNGSSNGNGNGHGPEEDEGEVIEGEFRET